MSRGRIFGLPVMFAVVVLVLSCRYVEPEERDWRAASEEGGADAFAAFLERYPDGKHAEEAEGALGRGFAREGRWTDARAHFERLAARKPDDVVAARSVLVAGLGPEGEELRCRFDATPAGTLRPMEAPWGLALPVEDDFRLQGTSECRIGEQTLSGVVDGWTYLYGPGTSDVVGWGAVFSEGEVILPFFEYQAYQEGRLPYTAEQSFEVAPFDYLGRYVRLSVSREKNQSFVIPVLTPGLVDLLEYATGPMAPGSVYAIGESAIDPESGLPTEINVHGPEIVHFVSGNIYYADAASGPAGMRVDQNRVRRAFNAEALRIAIVGPSHYRGEIRLLDED